ncbi:MAG: YczE/YyaS/YitT family protein [Candidatus Nanopelagicaceae bacterium]
MIYWMNFFRPHKTVPNTPWTGIHSWDLAPIRVVILSLGLFIFGLGDSLVIQSTLGNAPWSVLAQGISNQLEISIGTATLLVSAFVLAMWIPLRERPGFGTIMNILIIAGAIDVGIWIFPSPHSFPFQVIYVLLGIAMVGAGSALYITCGLGPGPRDGWMTALHKRTGVRVGRVRLGIELSVLSLGWFLGGTFGLGTALFALLIGHSVAISFGVVSRLTAR